MPRRTEPEAVRGTIPARTPRRSPEQPAQPRPGAFDPTDPNPPAPPQPRPAKETDAGFGSFFG